MATRKQRRRRQKELRHEYETIVYDEEGNEVEVDREAARREREERDAARAAARAKAKPAGGTSSSTRSLREVKPPSWERAFKRGGLMGGLMLLVFLFAMRGSSAGARLAWGLFYAVAFVPLTYAIDKWAYRAYLRRTSARAVPKGRRS